MRSPPFRRSFMLWKAVTEKSAQEADVHPDFLANAIRHLRTWIASADSLNAGTGLSGSTSAKPILDSLVRLAISVCQATMALAWPILKSLPKKILSCVARVKERFGINHVAQVLHGADTDAVRSRGHDRLSTYGLLKEHDRLVIQVWIAAGRPGSFGA